MKKQRYHFPVSAKRKKNALWDMTLQERCRVEESDTISEKLTNLVSIKTEEGKSEVPLT